MSQQDLTNRLKKNLKKRKGPLSDWETQTFRLYEKDLPDYPFIIDIYEKYALIWKKGRQVFEDDEKKSSIVKEVLKEVLNIEDSHIILKERKVRTRFEQTQKLAKKNREIVIQEGPLQYKINLTDYLDTGLFLDHRPLRKWLRQEMAQMKKVKDDLKMLNLFSYTCSAGLCAAWAGAETTNIDLSQNYLNWGKINYTLNEIDPKKHHFLAQSGQESFPNEYYDVIYIDPPTFSNSKKTSDFDVQVDHVQLITRAMRRLDKKGILYFSCNKRDFELASEISEQYHVQDKTKESLPFDFNDPKIHHLYRITLRKES